MMPFTPLMDPLACDCVDFDPAGGLLSIDATVERIESATSAVKDVEELPLIAALGRVVADPVIAGSPVPPFDNSAMDGYAVRTSSLQGQGPWALPVVAQIATGSLERVDPDREGVVQIFTGARLPAGFDAVVMQDRVQRSGDRIILQDRPVRGANIRYAGANGVSVAA